MLHRKSKRNSDLFALPNADGEIDRAVDGTLWTLQKKVELRGNRLEWTPDPGREIGPSKGMLAAFCRLVDASPQRIRDFARRHGALRICEHNLPYTHNPQECRPLGWDQRRGDGDCWESLDIWRAFSGEASALIRVADRLLQGNVGRAEDWQVIYGRSEKKAPWWKQGVDVERVIIARVVNEWLHLGHVRPVVVWHVSDTKPSVRLGGSGGLFGALALQLALAVGQSAGFAVCTDCRKEYSPTRRPKSGQRNFCPECREAGIPTRYSLADYRERLRKGH